MINLLFIWYKKLFVLFLMREVYFVHLNYQFIIPALLYLLLLVYKLVKIHRYLSKETKFLLLATEFYIFRCFFFTLKDEDRNRTFSFEDPTLYNQLHHTDDAARLTIC